MLIHLIVVMGCALARSRVMVWKSIGKYMATSVLFLTTMTPETSMVIPSLKTLKPDFGLS